MKKEIGRAADVSRVRRSTRKYSTALSRYGVIFGVDIFTENWKHELDTLNNVMHIIHITMRTNNVASPSLVFEI